MTSIKVIDINEEAKQEEPQPEIIEEAEEETKQEAKEEINELTKEEQTIEVNKENIAPKKEENEPLKNNSKTERLKDKTITCPKCSKSMLLRSYRYKHEQNCQGKLEDRVIKPKSKALPKTKITQPKVENTIEKQEVVKTTSPVKLNKEVSNQILKPQPTQPQLTPYEIARQSYIQMKEAQKARKIEKINMFKSKMF